MRDSISKAFTRRRAFRALEIPSRSMPKLEALRSCMWKCSWKMQPERAGKAAAGTVQRIVFSFPLIGGVAPTSQAGTAASNAMTTLADMCTELPRYYYEGKDDSTSRVPVPELE